MQRLAFADDEAVGLVLEPAVDRDDAHVGIRHAFAQLGDLWRTSGAPATARTDTRQASPPANSRTCSASGYSISLPM